MEQARVTDYFRACKRQPIKQKDEKVQLPYKSPFNDIKLESESKCHLELESTPKSKDSEVISKLRSVPFASRRSHKAHKLRKRGADESLLKTPTNQSFDGNSANKLLSKSARKRLLRDDRLKSSTPCKRLKYESPEKAVEFQGKRKCNAYTVLKEQDKRCDDTSSADICQKLASAESVTEYLDDVPNKSTANENSFNPKEVVVEYQGEKKCNTCTVAKEQDTDKLEGRRDDKSVSSITSSANICQKLVSANAGEIKECITENVVALLPNESVAKTSSCNTKKENGTEDAIKVQLTKCKNTVETFGSSQKSPVQMHIATKVSEEAMKDGSKGLTKEQRMKAIQEKLSKLKSLKAKVKETQEKHAELKEKYSNETPAYQKYYHLASLPSKTLPLPYKYKSLEETFQSTDRTVSILHNRHEVCTFSKLKQAVQQMTRRTFNKTHLGQFKSVFPQAYEYSVEKHLNTLSTDGSSGSQLTIIPNFDYGNNKKPGGVGSLCNQLQKSGINIEKTDKSFLAMNSTCLSERKSIFNRNLLEITKRYHEKFLANLNPPVHVPSDKICRWHPRFPLYDVPDIPSAPLPELSDNNHYPTAKDVLNLINNKVEGKVGNALQSVAEKHKEIQIPNQKPYMHELVKKGALKGISQSLVEKIRAREALRMQKVMTRQPDVEKRLEMISRFPELVSILRNYFITSKKAAIAIDDVSMKVSESYRSHLASENAEQHLYLMADLLPEWISIITISKGPFVKIDKNKDAKIVIEKINQLIKQES